MVAVAADHHAVALGEGGGNLALDAGQAGLAVEQQDAGAFGRNSNRRVSSPP